MPTPSPSHLMHRLWNDARIVWHMVFSRGRGRTHEERLEHFYRGQAAGYDAFRRRLLHGREELFRQLPAITGGIWVDLGAGTGENAEHWGPRLQAFSQVYLVDLAPSLLAVARERIATRGWTNVQAVHHDATMFMPPEGTADVVTCSYSLTMIPDWFAAIDRAWQMLRPHGIIGVVDFFVARKFPPEGTVGHGWTTRSLWPLWFATDNVFLSPRPHPLFAIQVRNRAAIPRAWKGSLPPWCARPLLLLHRTQTAGLGGTGYELS
ncbi:MAG: ubiquinone/menaquinone biosynthesis methyltransferase [Planctomycetaceae bacterium]|nr:MAG: ubiquinone/menaquinone biosynthesis methyltransferase [Planctomycetaceae bacterium]